MLQFEYTVPELRCKTKKTVFNFVREYKMTVGVWYVRVCDGRQAGA